MMNGSGEVDIYTRERMSRPSREHVVPSFMGGRLSAILVDKATNDQFGSTIDAALCQGLEPVIGLMGITPHRGNRHGRHRSLALDDNGRRYNLTRDGEWRPESRMKMRRSDVGIEVEAVGSSVDKVASAVMKRLEREGKACDEATQGRVIHQLHELAIPVHKPTLRVSLSTGSKDIQHGIAKIACNLLAWYDRELFLTAAFDPIRAYVWTGQWLPLGSPVEVPSVVYAGGLHHFVLVRGQGVGQPIDATVICFGRLAYVVRLAEQNPAGRIAIDYQVDPQLGWDCRQRTPSLDRLTGEYDAAAQRPYEEALDAATRQVGSLMESAIAMHRFRLWTRTIVEDAWSKHAGDCRNLDLRDEADVRVIEAITRHASEEIGNELRATAGSITGKRPAVSATTPVSWGDKAR